MIQSLAALEETLYVRQLGRCDYLTVWDSMKSFTDSRDESTADELWFVEHEPVFTQGQAGKAEHLIAPGDIPVVYADRGGQVTYHGPGQQVVYVMLNLKRKNIGVRQLVTAIEDAMIQFLTTYQILATARADAPGVYTLKGEKICSIGLRIRKGCSFHGLALNVNLDLEPFDRINPCGFKDLKVTSMALNSTPISKEPIQLSTIVEPLADSLVATLGYNHFQIIEESTNELEIL